jgi:hypothetical protein
LETGGIAGLMLYSCFDDKSARYRVYEDERQHAVNADLPVPSLPRDAGRVGVASIEAARPFPRGARRVGDSWQPRGVVVRCPGLSFGAADGETNRLWTTYGPVLLAGGAAMLIWWIYKR